MEDFKKLPKMQHFKTGGSVKAYTKRDRKETDAADIKQDKAIVKKAFKLHDAQEHKGEKTDLSTLKKGGRAKKAVGTVKKYKCGGNVKKMAGGGSLEEAALLNALPGKVNEIERAQMAARAKNALKYLGPAQQSEFVNQGGMNTGARLTNADLQFAKQAKGIGAPAPGARLTNADLELAKQAKGQKKGGKVKKYADGSSVSTDDVISAIRSGKAVDNMPRPKRSDGTNPALSRIVGNPEDTKYVDRMPMPSPSDTVNIPGIGTMKRAPTKTTPSGAALLKKGGKACK